VTPPNLRLVLTLSLIASFMLAACGSGTSTAAPSVTATRSTLAANATPGPVTSSPSDTAAAVGQTDTDWGRIWDTLPAEFPKYPGATPAEEAATGAASATWVVNGNLAKAVIASMRTSLEAAGFSTTEAFGPLEDGAYAIDLRGATDACRVNVTAYPQGSLTTVTILYGAACPHS
jgi:hypothetical protein